MSNARQAGLSVMACALLLWVMSVIGVCSNVVDVAGRIILISVVSLFLGALGFVAWLMTRSVAIQDRRDAGQCLVCGYDLRGAPERCLECGMVPARPEART